MYGILGINNVYKLTMHCLIFFLENAMTSKNLNLLHEFFIKHNLIFIFFGNQI